ncbi:alpha/beta hydrolase family protein [Paenibacillus sp. GCM10023248]|uniref:alpha/beta hydrolase family protein n=1 Tax=Bacillales TaxID=1385 RepID=UPI0023790359|nr:MULTISPECIES: alpha/beta hydrolase family protein [Bacillales]MDD9268278.1 alpha/beta hydrolase family protein [Paenibacillus sp. MAHUQ-63]MDR6879956.1 dienelactone hydrolase [Bacillus sp. 3255]
MWNPDTYFQRLLQSTLPSEAFQAQSQEEWKQWRERLRSRFVELLGGFPEETAELQPVQLETADCGTYIRQRIQIQTYPGLIMPVYVLIPKNCKERAGAIVACHGHGYGSKDIVGLTAEGKEKEGEPGYQRNFALELVNRGFIVAAPELLGFGDRKLQEEAQQSNSCHRLSTLLLAVGQTMAGYRVYETLRCVDYLLTRNDVDSNRVGCMGISGGGLVSAFASAIDDRISAAVVSGYANTFQASILSIHHCVDNYIPGLSALAEMPDLLGLIAPKPLLLEAGDKDPIFPVHAALEAYEKVQSVYELLGVKEKVELDLFDGPHEISGRVAYDWFLKVWS